MQCNGVRSNTMYNRRSDLKIYRIDEHDGYSFPHRVVLVEIRESEQKTCVKFVVNLFFSLPM